MKRKTQWKQDTPRMQAGTLVGSAMGDIGNVLEGIAKDRIKALNRALTFLEQVQEILKAMPEGSWDENDPELRQRREFDDHLKNAKCYSDLDR